MQICNVVEKSKEASDGTFRHDKREPNEAQETPKHRAGKIDFGGKENPGKGIRRAVDAAETTWFLVMIKYC